MKETSFSIKIKRIFSQSKEFVREGMIHLEGDLSLSSLMTRFSHKIVSLSLRVSLKKTVNRIRLFHRFGKYLIVMNKRHGSLFVVKYLKAASLAISKVLAGEPLVSLRELEPDLPLPRLSKSGLPVIIGTRDRRSIVSLSHRVVRMYLSLFSLYRVIKVEGELKTKTITDPYSGDPLFLNILGR